MLASMLRRLILIQVLMGAGIGAVLMATMHWSLLEATLLALLTPWVLAVLTHVALWWRSRPDGPTGPWVQSLWGEIHAGCLIFLLRQPWATRAPGILPPTSAANTKSNAMAAGKSVQAAQPAAEAPAASVLPVILVHGFVCNHRIWDDLTARLRARGHAVMPLDLEPLFTSIDRYAAALESAVQELQRATGTTQVALIGHSMGGLAIRAWMRQYGCASAAGVITLGTPHAGTVLGRRALAPNARQMDWQSPWLAELLQSETAACRSLIRVAFSLHDHIIVPQRAQVLPDNTPTIFSGLGHLQLCLDPGVHEWVEQQLDTMR